MGRNNKITDTTKEIKKEMIRQAGNRFVEWYDENLANIRKFWLKEFVYPIVFPMISMAILRYGFNFMFNRTEGFLMFSMLYLLTITGRLLGKYNKLIQVLDPLIDEVMELKERGEKN